MNNPILLSNSWYFKPQFCQEDLSHFDADADCGGWQKVNLPHTVKELPFNCFFLPERLYDPGGGSWQTHYSAF